MIFSGGKKKEKKISALIREKLDKKIYSLFFLSVYLEEGNRSSARKLRQIKVYRRPLGNIFENKKY